MRSMGAVLLGTMVVLTSSVAVNAGPGDEVSEEIRAEIEAAARDYIDGWYEGDPERMARALHPDLVKRRVNPVGNGRYVLNSVTADAMIEYTRAGGGKRDRQEGQVNEVSILDVESHTATVKTVSPHFIDYLHMARINDRWCIVNVLWEPAPK